MARGSSGKAFNTIAGLVIVVGAILVGYYVFRGISRSGLGQRLEGIGAGLGGGGGGTLSPIGGGQFSPVTAPLANVVQPPAVVAREVTPNFSPVTTAGGIVTTGAFADFWSGLFKDRFGAPTLAQASTFPTASPTGPAPTYIADATGVSITGGGRVALNQKFLGYAPGTNVPIWGR